MMAHSYEEDFLKVLRWMRENINLASAIYGTKSNKIAIDPAVTLDNGNPVRAAASSYPPANHERWFLNSVAGLTACCYMDALGKIEQRGNRKNALNTFAYAHMPDLVAECAVKGGKYSIKTLYKIYRCGFVHQFAAEGAVWGRCGRDTEYWFTTKNNTPGLNIDRLAKGVVDGIDCFEAAFKVLVSSGTASYEDFFVWLKK